MKFANEERSIVEYALSRRFGGLYAFTTTRHGGVSTGTCATFNQTATYDTSPEAVAENRARLMAWLGDKATIIIKPKQTHTNTVKCIDHAFLSQDEKSRQDFLLHTDALITDVPNVCIAVSTADCIPVILYDKRKKAIAAVHAGWRGTVSGIVSRTIELMQQTYGTVSTDIWACIGVGISLDAFEVGDEVYEEFRSSGFPMERIAEKRRKWHLDLKAANHFLLLEAGVPLEQVEVSSLCSRTQEEDFFSARALGVESGRMLTGAVLY